MFLPANVFQWSFIVLHMVLHKINSSTELKKIINGRKTILKNQIGEGIKMGHLQVIRRPIEVLHYSHATWQEQ